MTARVVGLCLLVIVLDGFDMLVIALTAPAIAADWGLPAHRLGPLFAAGILGMIGGSVLIAPLGDRLGRVRVLMLCCGLFGLFAGLDDPGQRLLEPARAAPADRPRVWAGPCPTPPR